MATNPSAIEIAARALVRESELETQANLFESLAKKFFLAQGDIFLRSLDTIESEFPIVESESVVFSEAANQPPWEPVFDAVSRENQDILVVQAAIIVGIAMTKGAAMANVDLGVGIAFDLENPAAVTYIEEFGARLVTRVNATTKDQLRSIIANGVRRGDSYGVIQQAIAEKFRSFSESRTRMIAVNETGNAYEEAGSIHARELVSQGLSIQKQWSTVQDERVTELCRANSAMGWVDEAATFTSGHKRPLRFPRCRCGLIRRRESGEI